MSDTTPCASCGTQYPTGDDPEYPGWPHLQTNPMLQGKDGRVAGARPGEGLCKYCRQNAMDDAYGIEVHDPSFTPQDAP